MNCRPNGILLFVTAILIAQINLQAIAASIAGNDTPGTTTYPNGGLTRIGKVTFAADETRGSVKQSAVIDLEAGFAYFGTDKNPGKIVKVDLATFTRVAALTLNNGEGNLTSAVIDSAAGFVYFGTTPSIFSGTSGRVVKIDLKTFTRVEAITLAPGEIETGPAVIDPAAGFAYFSTGYQGSLAKLVKIDLATFTRVGSIELNKNSSGVYSAVIDPAAGFAYFGTGNTPGRVLKVDLATFDEVSSLTLNSGENDLRSAVIDPAAGLAYFGTTTNPGYIVKIDLSTFTRLGVVSLVTSQTALVSGVIDPAAGIACFGTDTSPENPGRVVKIDLPTFTHVGTLMCNSGEHSLRSGVIDPAAKYALFSLSGDPTGRVLKIGLRGRKDFVNAMRFTMPEMGAVTTAHFYSHTAGGNIRLAIYSDAGTARSLLWESASTSNTTTGGWIDIPVASGIPGELILPAANYWLSWQTDTIADVAGHTAGNAGDGFYAEHSYGAFPTGISTGSVTPTADRWGTYIIYEAIAASKHWENYQ